MRRRWKGWLALTAAVVVLVGAVAWALVPVDPPGINVGTYRRIRLGMTADEVEALVGLPPGSHLTRQEPGFWSTLYEQGSAVNHQSYSADKGQVTFKNNTGAAVGRGLEWRNDDFVLVLALEDGKVAWKRIGQQGRPTTGLQAWWLAVENLFR